MKKMSWSVLLLLQVVSSAAAQQQKPVSEPVETQPSKQEPNLTPEFAKAAFLAVEGIVARSPRADDLYAEAKFAAKTQTERAVVSEITSFEITAMAVRVKINSIGSKYVGEAKVKGVFNKKEMDAEMQPVLDKWRACVSGFEQQLKSRIWTGKPEPCQEEPTARRAN
jgi:hypothetical protein